MGQLLDERYAPSSLKVHQGEITPTYTRYWNNQWQYGVEEGPNIETITDTLGRTIEFYYERTGAVPNEKDLLTAVTAPGLNGSAARVIMRLQYDTKNLSNAGSNYGFQAG